MGSGERWEPGAECTEVTGRGGRRAQADLETCLVTQAAPAGGLRRGRLGAELGGTERAVTPEKGLPCNTMSFIEAGPP